MDRSWLLFMPPAGLSAWSRLTRVGRLRHEGDRLWMDLQTGTVTLELSEPMEITLSQQADGDRPWLGVEVRQGRVRLSLQCRMPLDAIPAGTVEGRSDAPRVGKACMEEVLRMLGVDEGHTSHH